MLVFSYYFIFHTKQLYKLLLSLSKKIKYFHKSKKVILDTLEHCAVLNTSSKLHILLVSFFVWFFSLFPWIFIITTLTEVDIKKAIIVTIIALVASFIPIHPPGGIGTVEGSWLIGLILVGISYGTAVNISVFIHSIFLIQIILLYSISTLSESYGKILRHR